MECDSGQNGSTASSARLSISRSHLRPVCSARPSISRSHLRLVSSARHSISRSHLRLVSSARHSIIRSHLRPVSSARPSISRSHLRPVTVHTADRNVSTGPGPNGQETQLAPLAARYFTFTISRFSSDIFLCAALALNRTEVLYSTEKHGCDLGSSFCGADPKKFFVHEQ